MECSFYVFFLTAFSFLRGLSAQETSVITYSSKEVQQLECDLANAEVAQWLDVDKSLGLCSYSKSSGNITKVPDEPKYANFNCSVTGGNFYLNIRHVDKDDGGSYSCSRFSGNPIGYSLTVEVIPREINITNSGNEFVKVNESHNFTCTAVGVRSPNKLNLTWSISNVMQTAATTRKQNEDDPDLEDLTSMLTFTPRRDDDDKFMKCSINEYVNQEEINEDLITDELQLDVQYQPVCTLETSNGMVGDNSCSVTLTCKCQANPEVLPDGYSYFNGNDPIDGNDVTITANIGLETSAEFSCRGRNDVGAGDRSPVQVYSCSKGVNAAAVAGGVVGGVAVVVLVIGVVYIVKKRVFCEKCTDEKNDKTDGNGMPMSEAPEYAAVDKPLNSEPKPAPRSSQPPPNNSTEKQELQYADIDHSSRTPSNQIRQPAEAPTEYATVQSVIV